MPSIDEILSLLALIYSDIIEPLFCIIYAYILLRIIIAKSTVFHSEFYIFSIATGVAAIVNVMMAWTIRMVDYRFQYFPNRGFFLNMVNMTSLICAQAISIGKVLSVATRFTAICLMHKHIWDNRLIRVCMLVMFGVSIVMYSFFFLFPPVILPTPNEYGYYYGIANPGFLIAKACATFGYLLFYFTTVPMCILSVLKLRSERLMDRLTSDSHEKMLAFYAVVLTSSHMLKSILQTVWFVALLSKMKDLQTTVTSLYLLPNTLSAFAELVLLLITSSQLRDEVFPWRNKEGSGVKISTVASAVTNTTPNQRRVSSVVTSHVENI